MSASPANPNPLRPRENPGANSTGAQTGPPPAASYAPGREALQALLAFSSLHQQIRDRRARQMSDGVRPDTTEIWGPEQFVLDEVLQLVSERALAITGTDGVAIALAEGDEIRCRASAGRIAPDAGARLDPTSGFSGACLRTGLIVRCDDSEKDPRVDREACRLLGLHSIVAVPLMTERGVIGLLAAFCSEPYGFNDSDVRSLSLLAELILAAMKPEEDARATQTSAARGGEARRTIPPPVIEASKIGAAKVEVAKTQAPKVEALKIELPSAPAQKIQTPKAQEPATKPAPTQVPKAPAVQVAVAPEVLPPEPQIPELQIPEFQAPELRAESPAADALPNMQSLREALARVTEESGQLPPLEPLQAPESSSTFPFSQSIEPRNSKRGLAMAMAFLFLLLAVALTGGTLWWRQHHGKQPAVVTAPQQTGPDASSSSAEASVPAAAGESNPASPAQKTASSELTGVRHWSSLDSSTVAIDLQDQVQYEAHRLTNPERIYFDLHDTTLSAGLLKNIEVGDALLVRIRVAQPTPDVTRVVLETKDSPNFSVSMETNPYRLVVEIRSVGAKPKASRLDLFAPMNPDGSGQQRASVAALPGTWLSPQTASNAENTQLRAHSAKFRIVLDAGHGGWDMGTVGRKGLLEKNLVLDIVARLGSLVSNRLGAEVIYTRRDDSYVSLEQRTETANLSQADMFLSVHGNYSDLPSARGVETYYTNTFSSDHAKTHDGDSSEALNVELSNVDVRGRVQQSRVFAERVQQALYHALLKKDPAVRDRGVREASYVVLTGTTMPAVLAEVSFVSSPTDEARLENPAYRQQIAEALYKGIATYAEGSHRVNMASAAAGQ